MLKCGSSAIQPRFIELAQSKLVGPSDILPELDTNAKFALLDCRLSFEYEAAHTSARRLQEEFIAHHLRIAYSAYDSRESLRSGYPSEPIVAEAAAQKMNELRLKKTSENINRDEMHEALVDIMERGYLSEGERGEIIARYLLLLAYDRAVDKEHAKTDGDSRPQIQYSRACTLVGFIDELVTDVVAKQILESKSDTTNPIQDEVQLPSTFRDTFKHARVRFTHWARTHDAKSLTTKYLLAAYIRGMAMICWRSQETVDLLIPVLICEDAEDETPLEESRMTAILIQVKNRQDVVAVSNFSAEAIKLFPKEDEKNRPYVTFLMDLGFQETTGLRLPPKATSIPDATTHKIPEVTPEYISPTRQTRQRAPIAHPRYNIHLCGCTSEVYNVIKENEATAYQGMLAKMSILEHHPHRNRESLETVLNMKPFWTSYQESYEWIDFGSDLATFLDEKTCKSFFGEKGSDSTAV